MSARLGHAKVAVTEKPTEAPLDQNTGEQLAAEFRSPDDAAPKHLPTEDPTYENAPPSLDNTEHSKIGTGRQP